MESYCVKCKKYTKNINVRVLSTSNGKATILLKCATCHSKKSWFIKNQEAKWLLSNLGLRTPLSTNIRWYVVLSTAPLNAIPLEYKMNEIVNKFLLAVDKFMPEMHLKQSGFSYSACGPFTKNKERIQKFKETGDTNYIYKNELDKACFQHDMVYATALMHVQINLLLIMKN